MITLLLASANTHKEKELKELIGNSSALAIQVAPRALDVEETGETFSENALLKAYAYYQQFKVPVVADDSGLVVEALPNELGVYSARFGGESAVTSEDRCHLLLGKMKGVQNRSAYFTCTLCCYLAPDEFYFFEGKVEGEIGDSMRGSDGFGYDPLFLPKEAPQGKTLAELPEWKQIHSHRARAVEAMKNFFSKR